jgi:hypothetical protein
VCNGIQLVKKDLFVFLLVDSGHAFYLFIAGTDVPTSPAPTRWPEVAVPKPAHPIFALYIGRYF